MALARKLTERICKYPERGDWLYYHHPQLHALRFSNTILLLLAPLLKSNMEDCIKSVQRNEATSIHAMARLCKLFNSSFTFSQFDLCFCNLFACLTFVLAFDFAFVFFLFVLRLVLFLWFSWRLILHCLFFPIELVCVWVFLCFFFVHSVFFSLLFWFCQSNVVMLLAHLPVMVSPRRVFMLCCVVLFSLSHDFLCF